MTIELRPLGSKCNINCLYCYQDQLRKSKNSTLSYDLEAMKNQIVSIGGGPFTLFGGEPLLIPETDLEDLWAWGFEKFGENSIQTNGILINDHIIELMKKYNVKVGVSIDGRGELNDARWAGTLHKTRAYTKKVLITLDKLLAVGIIPGLIVTLHQLNAAADKLPLLIEWFRELDLKGYQGINLHILESESDAIREHLALSNERYIEVFFKLFDLQQEFVNVQFNMFSEMKRILLGDDSKTTCIWNACDPYTTSAVQGIDGTGQRTNCGCVNKDGIDFLKSNIKGFERYIALHMTSQEYGGCKDCRFFLACKGQCPGTAIDYDWRNRSEYCSVWFALFEKLEKEILKSGKTPTSLHTHRNEIEEKLISLWKRGASSTVKSILEEISQNVDCC